MNWFETEAWDKYYESSRTLRVRIVNREPGDRINSGLSGS